MRKSCFRIVSVLAMAAILQISDQPRAEDAAPAGPQMYTHRIGGLFNEARENDLKDIIKRFPYIELVSIDFVKAEASFRYDEQKLFGRGTPQQISERFDSLLSGATVGTFRIKPPLAKPREKLASLEIPVAGLDCQGCCYGAYSALMQIPGVEQATVNFRDGRATALIDPDKTNRETLEKTLKDRGVEIKTP